MAKEKEKTKWELLGIRPPRNNPKGEGSDKSKKPDRK